MHQNRYKHFFYKNGQLTTEVGSECSVTVLSASNAPTAETRSDGRSAKTSLLALDLQSSILNSLHRDSTHTLAYNAYGHSNNAHSAASLLGFTGQRYDDLTRCYLLGNGYRAYSPTLARFFSADSLSPFTTRTHNAYAYCLGDPVNRYDPSGHMFRHVRQGWSGLKAKFKKPRSYHVEKAKKATVEHPEMEKFAAIIDDPNIPESTLRAIYKLPKHKAYLKELQAQAEENWVEQKGKRQPLLKPNIDHQKYLYGGDEYRYIGVVIKIDKYESRLSASETGSLIRRGS